MKARIILITGALYLAAAKFTGVFAQPDEIQANESDIGFPIPDLGEFLGFFIRLFFVLAGLLALFYMLWGALSWVTSGGETEDVAAARKKIIAAAVGVVLIVATLAVVVAMETIVFNRQVCFGISCPLTLPKLLKPCLESDPDGKCSLICVGDYERSRGVEYCSECENADGVTTACGIPAPTVSPSPNPTTSPAPTISQ